MIRSQFNKPGDIFISD